VTGGITGIAGSGRAASGQTTNIDRKHTISHNESRRGHSPRLLSLTALKPLQNSPIR